MRLSTCSRGRGLSLLVISLLLPLGACGRNSAGEGSGGDGLDLSELEAKLVQMQEEKSPDLEVEGAECPSDVELDEGASFECIVTIEGVEAPYAVTLTEDDPEVEIGSFHIEPAQAIIDVSIVIEFIRGQVEQSAGDVEVTCGDEKVIVGDVGDTFDCTVSDGNQTETVEMVIKDLEGTVAVNS